MLITRYQKYTGNYTYVCSVPCTWYTALGKSMHAKTGRSTLRLFSAVTSGQDPRMAHWYYTTLSGWELNQCTNKWSLYTVSLSSHEERVLYTLNRRAETDLIIHPLPLQLLVNLAGPLNETYCHFYMFLRDLFKYKIVIVMEVNQEEIHWVYAQKEHVKINYRPSSQKCGHLWAKTVIMLKID